jgi:hypothetical protein
MKRIKIGNPAQILVEIWETGYRFHRVRGFFFYLCRAFPETGPGSVNPTDPFSLKNISHDMQIKTTVL